MCFSQKPPQAVTPAAAPAQPEPNPTDTTVGSGRKAEEQAAFGADGPNFRLNRATITPSSTAGGTGLTM